MGLTRKQAIDRIDNSASAQSASREMLPILVSGEYPDGSPFTLATTAEAAGAFGYAAGSAGTVHVPTGARVRTVTAQTESSAGSLTINGGAPVPIAANGSFDDDLRGAQVGPVDIVFTGTTAYYVGWEV